jgi:hypothetical protein
MAKYDAKAVTKATKTLRLEWHGAPTLVKLEDGAAKVEVNTGDVVEVNNERAEFLLHYSPLWTLEGDQPLEQSKPSLPEAPKAKQSDKKASEKAVNKMTKPELLEAAKARGLEVAEDAKVADLRTMIAEHDAAKNEGTEDDGEGDEETEE